MLASGGLNIEKKNKVQRGGGFISFPSCCHKIEMMSQLLTRLLRHKPEECGPLIEEASGHVSDQSTGKRPKESGAEGQTPDYVPASALLP